MTCEFCNVEHTVAVPCVHSNGTSSEELRDLLDAAAKATRCAIRSALAASPNARDYYVYSQTPPAIVRVALEHKRRIEKLADVARELTEMRDHVMEVIEFKAEAKRRQEEIIDVTNAR